jgi:serine/threonine-protein kinase
MIQLTDGLAHAHDAYIIHRDIKPQNILILDNGLVKITDFGIAMALNSSQLTQTNSVMGSVHYLPPEQASGKGSTIKSDIYSLGILMYELLTGKLPFKGENAVEIALKHMRDPLPSVRREIENVPQSIENIIIRSTAKNPKNRYNDAREMYEDLKTSLDSSRLNEPRYVYKYLENDVEDTKVLPVIKEEKIIDKESDTDAIAKQIDEDDFKPNKKLYIILGGIFLGLFAILFVIFLVIPGITTVPDVKIPDVTNLTPTKAEDKLRAVGFEVALEIKEENSDTIAKGKIVKTSPEEGRMVKKGTIITMYKSTGTLYIELEDYTGKDYVDVKANLIAKGLKVTEEKKDVDNVEDYKGKEDIIIGQSPATGTKLNNGENVILYIPNIYNLYPDMVKEAWSISDVEKFATDYKLNLTIEYQDNDTIEADTVIYQSRGANTPIVEGTSFRVTVTKPTTTGNEEADQ